MEHFKKAKEIHPIIAFIKEGKKEEAGWMSKAEAAALNKSMKAYIDLGEKSNRSEIRKCAQNLASLKKPSSYFLPTLSNDFVN